MNLEEFKQEAKEMLDLLKQPDAARSRKEAAYRGLAHAYLTLQLNDADMYQAALTLKLVGAELDKTLSRG